MSETTKVTRDDAQAKVSDIEGRISVLTSGRQASAEESDRIAKRLCGDVSAGELSELTIQKGQLAARERIGSPVLAKWSVD